ncbi:MAG: glycosyltransferase [Lentimicrobiaceae bacterium]|nr:glycosyltransferase [Lentimicrobiaceae bacterium]
MKILQINSALITDAPGRIAEEIGKVVIANGHESYFGFGRAPRPITSTPVKIGSRFDQMIHLVLTRTIDRHGFGSIAATREFIDKIKIIDPDIIHLHSLHGYYINIRVLFNYLKESNKPVVWTLHDCWPFTGHCSHYVTANCYKWENFCHHCPKKKSYPASWGLDNSTKNFYDKKAIFTSLSNLHFVSPSKWLAGEFKRSFLQQYPIQVIHNGIDLKQFHPEKKLDDAALISRFGNKPIILGVASVWGNYKGLDDFVVLNEMLKDRATIVLVGLNEHELKRLPDSIIGIKRTENIDHLAALYASASVFVNPTYADTFPTTNLEALASGTPVVTYRTGGSPEALDENTGFVVETGNIKALASAISDVIISKSAAKRNNCRSRAEQHFNKELKYLDYLTLYNSLLNQ